IVEASHAWRSDLVVKVKELQDEELERLPMRRALFGFQHLPHEPQRTRALVAREATAIAFEMVRDAGGGFPLLAPMSVIAGRMAIDVARSHMRRPVRNVVVLGAGNAGMAAAQAASECGADVTILRRANATPQAISEAVQQADLVVGAVFVPASPTPKLVPRSLVRRMRPGSMIVDISIDAGGVAETSRPTSHADPTYVEEGVIHYAVANMPAARPAEAAAALWRAAIPFVEEMARKGIGPAVRDNGALRAGVLLWRGRACHAGIAAEAGVPCVPLVREELS
ncbi:MAG TPA: alanine dehydrogenase, partial [Usitatibacter sp.]|nr:alanine dehydrogenase [Usitatibacter sp.]